MVTTVTDSSEVVQDDSAISSTRGTTAAVAKETMPLRQAIEVQIRIFTPHTLLPEGLEETH